MKITPIFSSLAIMSVATGCVPHNAPLEHDLRASSAFTHHVKSGQKVEFYTAYQLKTPCDTNSAVPSVKIIVPPQHGSAIVTRKMGHTNYPKWNNNYRCNSNAVPMAAVNYQSSPGFVGKDALQLRTDFINPADNPSENIAVTIEVAR
ncbi:hypothetical protein AB4037_06985 [Labrys sp. KB_33_2]|uniref:hypothetical protein n=1 Tax=Labrys sp. KB_33_2 TaxID=3237479 RepID=UPI003F8F7F78